ncbi:MAG: NAD(P)H-dependent oxidoreductase [Leptospiraceae bacterium]|nr:NAD(P)H-dependent oxidoreductase [Leptospiraceae bacterium]
MNILGISGSLRKGSSNMAILHAMARHVPKNVHFSITTYIDQLPHFNPDLEKESVLTPVKIWRKELAAANGYYISCPEYAHGVPGVLKNALDWVVSSGEFVGKPIAFLNASPIVKASLVQTLTVMSGRIIENASVQIQFLRNKVDKEGILSIEDEISHSLETSLQIMIQHIQENQI